MAEAAEARFAVATNKSREIWQSLDRIKPKRVLLHVVLAGTPVLLDQREQFTELQHEHTLDNPRHQSCTTSLQGWPEGFRRNGGMAFRLSSDDLVWLAGAANL